MNIDLTFNPVKPVISSISETVDYVGVFSIAKKHMSNPTQLLETLVMDIAREISTKFIQVDEIAISLYKLNAPISSFSGKVGVTYHWNRGI